MAKKSKVQKTIIVGKTMKVWSKKSGKYYYKPLDKPTHSLKSTLTKADDTFKRTEKLIAQLIKERDLYKEKVTEYENSIQLMVEMLAE